MASDKVITITEDNFTSTIAEGVTLVDFWAPWCGPCRMLAPVIDKVADTIGDDANVAKCNTDEAGSVATQFGIQSIPTLLIFKDGAEVERLMGAAQREADLVTKIKSHI
jgi:thioredoxin 1